MRLLDEYPWFEVFGKKPGQEQCCIHYYPLLNKSYFSYKKPRLK